MSTFEAVRTGFRIVRRHPGIGAIETIWRTAYTILVLLFGSLGFSFFLQNATLSNLELQALRSKVPVLVSLTIQRLLIRYWSDLWHLILFIFLMSSVMWLVFATLFRSGILGMLRSAFERGRTREDSIDLYANFGADVKLFFRPVGSLNVLYLFSSTLVVILSGGVFWGSVRLGVLVDVRLTPLVTIVCLTLGLAVLFVIWALLDLTIDLAQLAVVFEKHGFAASIRRAAEVIQKKFGVVIGIGLIIFINRVILAIVFGIGNMVTNFVLSVVWPPMILPVTVVLWFVQSVFMYYLYILNLASLVCLFEPQKAEASTQLPFTEKIIYEH